MHLRNFLRFVMKNHPPGTEKVLYWGFLRLIMRLTGTESVLSVECEFGWLIDRPVNEKRIG
jgi:hypothetical protein